MKSIGLYASIFIILAMTGIGCIGNSPDEVASKDETGKLVLPLVAEAESGIQYKLRDAVFDIVRDPYYYPCDPYGGGCIVPVYPDAGSMEMGGSMGIGGKPGPTPVEPPASTVINTEDDPDAVSMEVELEEGYYSVTLRPGWRMEKTVDGQAQTVEATLLNGNSQWVDVTRHKTSLVAFEFGIGERSIWLDGKLHVNINAFEDPDDYYGPWTMQPPSTPAACRAMVGEFYPGYIGAQSNCLCNNCTYQYGQCLVDAGCEKIIRCAIDNGCGDVGCTLSACSDLISAFSSSVMNALMLSNCNDSSQCSAPPDGNEPPTPQGDAGLLP